MPIFNKEFLDKSMEAKAEAEQQALEDAKPKESNRLIVRKKILTKVLTVINDMEKDYEKTNEDGEGNLVSTPDVDFKVYKERIKEIILGESADKEITEK